MIASERRIAGRTESDLVVNFEGPLQEPAGAFPRNDRKRASNGERTSKFARDIGTYAPESRVLRNLRFRGIVQRNRHDLRQSTIRQPFVGCDPQHAGRTG